MSRSSRIAYRDRADGSGVFSVIAQSRLFLVAPFDQVGAIELAFLNRDVFKAHDPKGSDEAYQKIKIDRQIIAIFKVCGAEQIYTDDIGLAKRAKMCGLTPIATEQLPLPADEKQASMVFDPHDAAPEATDPSED